MNATATENVSMFEKISILNTVNEFRKTKTALTIVALYAIILCVNFSTVWWLNGIVLGLAFGLLPKIISNSLEFGMKDKRLPIIIYGISCFDVLFMTIVGTVIGSFTMFATGVFPPVFQLAIASLIGRLVIVIPFIASLHWHQKKGVATYSIVTSLIMIYSFIVWVSILTFQAIL
jgi:hypothetical protein